MLRCLFALVLNATILGSAAAQAAKYGDDALDPNLPCKGERSNPVTYDVDFAVVVTAPYHTKVLKVWLPMPQSSAAQEVEERRLSSYPDDVKPRVASEPVHGNRFAYGSSEKICNTTSEEQSLQERRVS